MTTTPEDKRLKPCPFCGGTSIDIRPNNIGDFYAICYDNDRSEVSCGASTSDSSCETPEGAARRWNARAPDPESHPLGTEDKRLREIAERIEARIAQYETPGVVSYGGVICDADDLRVLLSLLDRALAAEGERDEALSAQGLYARTLFSLKDTLLNVTDDIEDEGDRAYFGSSNDADALRAVTQRIDALHWDEVLAHTQPKVDLYTAIENRMAETRAAESRALAAEARVLGLVEALKTIERVTTDFGAQDCAARALLSLAHGGVEGMGASRASHASEGLRPFASDSAAEVGRSGDD